MFFATAMTLRHFVRYAGIRIGAVVVASAKALALVAVYYAGAWLIHHELAGNVSRNLELMLLVSLGGCLLLGLALTGIALKLRVLVLGIFSGH